MCDDGCCRFPSLGLPSPGSLPWGTQALARDFASARDLFNTSMTYFKEAMDYYKLDGWVTEHGNIVMEISNLFRCVWVLAARCGAADRGVGAYQYVGEPMV